MRLKVYHAPNIGAAMTMVRTELGPDALIIATRPAEGGGVEVTAALEPALATLMPPVDARREAALRWHGVPEPIRPKLARGDLTGAISSEFAFAALPVENAAPPLLFFGPPGAGKTLTVAKLATRLVLAGQRPLVITADGQRAGAAEQLAAFTRLLGLTLIAADEPVTIARALARRTDGAPVLIDTPGLDGADPRDRETAQTLLAATGAAATLVLPAGLDPSEAGDIAGAFETLGATMLVATRLDQSRRLGGIIAAAGAGLAFTEAGIGAGVVEGLDGLTPAFLAERLQAGAPGHPPSRSPVPDVPRPLPPYIRPRQAQPRPVS